METITKSEKLTPNQKATSKVNQPSSQTSKPLQKRKTTRPTKANQSSHLFQFKVEPAANQAADCQGSARTTTQERQEQTIGQISLGGTALSIHETSAMKIVLPLCQTFQVQSRGSCHSHSSNKNKLLVNGYITLSRKCSLSLTPPSPKPSKLDLTHKPCSVEYAFKILCNTNLHAKRSPQIFTTSSN